MNVIPLEQVSHDATETPEAIVEAAPPVAEVTRPGAENGPDTFDDIVSNSLMPAHGAAKGDTYLNGSDGFLNVDAVRAEVQNLHDQKGTQPPVSDPVEGGRHTSGVAAPEMITYIHAENAAVSEQAVPMTVGAVARLNTSDRRLPPTQVASNGDPAIAALVTQGKEAAAAAQIKDDKEFSEAPTQIFRIPTPAAPGQNQGILARAGNFIKSKLTPTPNSRHA